MKSNMPVEHQKVVKLSEGPDTGLSDGYRGAFVVSNEIGKMQASNLFNWPDSLRFQARFEFVEPDA